VKLEGGIPVIEQVKAIAKAGIPVMGHVGYNPQYQVRDAYVYNAKRGTIPKIQGKGPKGARSLLEIGQQLQDAGAFALVIELVTVEVASLMAEKLTIPIIGIGSGGGCDGQVLVFNDIVGLSNFELSLLTPYAKTRKKWLDAISLYRRDVESQHFPADMHCIHMEPDKIASLEKTLKDEGK
ncbi:MAG: 3-methyl-2-oxobutanoate hydroxymethyltransferase, partial [Candidatus Latescibacterota bacterium]|nr:3-methyl-2-oxobutanoate hydroxymethyltransferase [Candidatus Latescibacterota bacterium]